MPFAQFSLFTAQVPWIAVALAKSCCEVVGVLVADPLGNALYAMPLQK